MNCCHNVVTTSDDLLNWRCELVRNESDVVVTLKNRRCSNVVAT